MKNIEDEFKRSAESILDTLITSMKELIQNYKDGYWEEQSHDLLKVLYNIRIRFKNIQEERLEDACDKYKNLELLPEKEVNLQQELNKILVEMDQIIHDIEQKRSNIRT
jgi:inhibitor of KinA sporulation pathway (predicted exonuclease)